MKYARFYLPTREHRITTLWKLISDDIAAAQTLQCTKCIYIYIIHILLNSNESYESRTVEYTLALAVTYIYYIIIYYARREENKTKKNLTRISYTYIMFIYYYARLTTGRVLFFHCPANTENPPAVDNRNIHHMYNSFPIDTFTYFYVEDKKKIRWYCPRFSAIFPPFILLGDCRPVRHIVYTIYACLKVILSSFYYIYTQSRRSLPQSLRTSTSAEEVCYRSV